jgi:hypothetical protein
VIFAVHKVAKEQGFLRVFLFCPTNISPPMPSPRLRLQAFNTRTVKERNLGNFQTKYSVEDNGSLGIIALSFFLSLQTSGFPNLK